MAVREGPPGYDDMLGDAERAPELGPYREIDVDGVGPVMARYPLPNATPVLACAYSDHNPAKHERAAQIKRFLTMHIEGGWQPLVKRMLDGELPADTLERVAAAVATMGAARPYLAVVILAVTTAHNWRDVRQYISEKGILNPMALPSMGQLLDHTEKMMRAACESEAELEQLQHRLYGPHAYTAFSTAPDTGGVPDVPPAGFEDAARVAAENRDAFAKLMR